MRFLGFSRISWGITRGLVAVVAVSCLVAGNADAQFNNGFFGRQVGGVKIDTDGVLRTVTAEEQSDVLNQMRQQLQEANGALSKESDLRLISLRKIQDLILNAAAEKKELPQDVLFLGGLTRVQYVFAIPERQDIVIAGPAEPWTINQSGTVVGKKSGKPIVYLEDLVEAFKYVNNARNGGISVSIDPTENGRIQTDNVLKNVTANTDMKWLHSALLNAMGQQQVSLNGVPKDSHLARVLLAADFRMKLYGMNLAKAPVQGLPSYLEMMQNKSSASTQLQSRWWMACDYNAIEHSKDKLAWSITGRGVKAMTEQEQINVGKVKQTGKVDAIAKKWADIFTKKIDELAVADPVFGELRNVMDLCVVAALIESQNLQSTANCDLSAILGDRAKVETSKMEVVESLDSQVTFVNTVQGVLVAVSGGVMIESWQAATNTKVNDSVASVQAKAQQWSTDNWYQ